MNGSLEEALGALDKATMQDPKNADAWQYKALTLRDLERFNESLEAFQRALELDPQDDQARTEMAGLLMVMGRSYEAASVLDSSPDRVPHSPQERLDQSIVWRLRGKILVEKGSYDEALEAYDRAIELGDGQPVGEATAWMGKGSLLMRLERYEDALLAFDSALQSDYPDKDGEGKPRQTLVGSEAWLGRGEALDALGRHGEAVEAYNKSVQSFDIDLAITPDAPKLWKEKADVLESLGRHDEAVPAYERAVELFRSEITTQTGPSNGWRYWWMGDALQALGRTSEAEAAFAKAKELGYQE
jgi:tetratricopeptide (TPR) repeat protein